MYKRQATRAPRAREIARGSLFESHAQVTAALGDRDVLVRSGAALVACRVADAAGLVAALASADEALVDGALRAVEFAAEERRVAAAPPLVDALRRLFAHGDGGCRRRALRCAARCGWLDGGSAALRELSGLAADPHAGVRAEVLACVAELRRRGGLEAAELGGVAQFALGALRDDDEKVATGAGKRCPTSKAPLSAGFHSFRLMFGRAIISGSALDAWTCLLYTSPSPRD